MGERPRAGKEGLSGVLRVGGTFVFGRIGRSTSKWGTIFEYFWRVHACFFFFFLRGFAWVLLGFLVETPRRPFNITKLGRPQA